MFCFVDPNEQSVDAAIVGTTNAYLCSFVFAITYETQSIDRKANVFAKAAYQKESRTV